MVTKWKKSAAVVAALALVFAPTTVRADDLHQKLNQYQQQYEQLNRQLADQKQQEATASQKVVVLQQSVQALNDEIASYKAQIDKQEQDLKNLEAQQQQLQAQRQQRVNELQNFLRANYENGLANYWTTLLSAGSWSELFDRVYELRSIVKYYDKLQKDIAAADKQLAQQHTAIRQKQDELQATLRDKEQSQQSLQQSMAMEQNALNQLSAQEKATLAAASEAQQNIAYVQEMIREEEVIAAKAAAQRQSGGGNYAGGGGISGPVTMSGTVSDLLAYARSFIGLPYVWGGTTPDPGFDCSGFTQYVFAHFGIHLNRTSEQQYLEGTPVAQGDLRPGDLVFFHTYDDGGGPGSATHVGIYMGNGAMINSEGMGLMIAQINDAYWGPRYLGARRVIKQ